MLSAKQSAALLRKYRIPIAKGVVVKDEDGAAKAAKKIGYPVAIKVDSPDIIHKTDRGVVAFSLGNEQELRDEYRRVIRNAGKARVRGVLVQEHCTGVEIIIGGKRDAQFGEVVLFGLGGIFVEVFKDAAIRVTPFSRGDADRMIKEVKGYQLLKGARGQKPADIKAIASVIMSVQKMMLSEKISELDLNPLFATPNGVKAADFRIIGG